MTGVGYPSPAASELVAGIFPRPTGITDPDVVLALNDRAETIERRARELATIAIERGDSWVQDFGDAPEAGQLYEKWTLEVAVGTAYLDRWSIDEAATFADDATVNLEKMAQRSRVLSAAQRARALAVNEETSVARAYVPSSDELLEPSSRDFGLDL
ncbi:MAG: hypothetical protein HIU84_08030 [Acidobacteria bacterium]|nr:hypothetical protein [Acidobacteriota bacterium]